MFIPPTETLQLPITIPLTFYEFNNCKFSLKSIFVCVRVCACVHVCLWLQFYRYQLDVWYCIMIVVVRFLPLISGSNVKRQNIPKCLNVLERKL